MGAIEGSDQIRIALDQKSDIARVIGSVSFEELIAALEYAMGPQARLDEAKQCIMSFDRDSMEDAMGERALGDHLFDHVPSRRKQEKTSSNGSTTHQPTSAAQAIERVDSVEGAEKIVKQALLDKFAAFIGDEVPADQPVVQLGLDSLVSIEIKNWVKHTFKTPLQASELSSAPSIIALAKLIVSRMSLKCRGSGEESKADSSPPPEIVTTNGHHEKPRHGCDCCRHSEELLQQPLPDLDDALGYLIETTGHLYSPEQLATVQQDIQLLEAPDSPIRCALQELAEAHQSEEMSNGWYNDAITEARWLSNRTPLAPYQCIMITHRDSKSPQSQSERAAIIAWSAFSFKKAMDAGEVEPFWIAGKPACTWRWNWLFNSVREPKVGQDHLVRYDGLDHIAVLRRGHVFKVLLHVEGEDVPLEKLKSIFEAIVGEVEDDGTWAGILTTDERNSWAAVSFCQSFPSLFLEKYRYSSSVIRCEKSCWH